MTKQISKKYELRWSYYLYNTFIDNGVLQRKGPII